MGPGGPAGPKGDPGTSRLDPAIIQTLEDLRSNALRKDATFYLKGGNDKYLSFGGGGSKGGWEKLKVEDVNQKPFASLPNDLVFAPCPAGFTDMGTTCFKQGGFEGTGLGRRFVAPQTIAKTRL
jgi:hypothetical protein